MAAQLSPLEEFIALFNKLKDAAKGDPARVRIFYSESETVRKAFSDLEGFLARSDLERRIFHGSKQFKEIPGFEPAWREYDARWRFRVPLSDLLDLALYLFGDDEPPAPRAGSPDRPRLSLEVEAPSAERVLEAPDPEQEDFFDPLFHDGYAAIELGIKELDFRARDEPTDDKDESIINSAVSLSGRTTIW
jgi:hypothetical protein